MLSSGKPPTGQDRSRRESIRLVAFAAAAADHAAPVPYSIPVAEKWRDAARLLLPPDRTYVGLAPGAGNQGNGKMWPLDNYIAVGQDQADKGRTPVILIGPCEMSWVERIRAALPEAVFPALDPSLPPGERINPALTVAMAGRLSAAAANCSGTGHMLGTGGTPMVSLFGPTNPRKYAPHGQRTMVLRSQDFGGTASIEAIPVAAVVKTPSTLRLPEEVPERLLPQDSSRPLH